MAQIHSCRHISVWGDTPYAPLLIKDKALFKNPIIRHHHHEWTNNETVTGIQNPIECIDILQTVGSIHHSQSVIAVRSVIQFQCLLSQQIEWCFPQSCGSERCQTNPAERQREQSAPQPSNQTSCEKPSLTHCRTDTPPRRLQYSASLLLDQTSLNTSVTKKGGRNKYTLLPSSSLLSLHPSVFYLIWTQNSFRGLCLVW